MIKGFISNQKIIIANNKLGELDGEFTFEVMDFNQARRLSTRDSSLGGFIKLPPRRTTKVYKKHPRDHSASWSFIFIDTFIINL